MRTLKLREEDLEETFVRSSGPGGQNVNKVSTCVVLRHRPSGLAVKCQSSRSQADNRLEARRRLLAKLQGLERRQKLEAARKISRQRIEKRGRLPGRKAEMLEEKKKAGEKKKLRRKIRSEGDWI